MRIAYLVNQYPKVSHTFIRREIAALERAGLQVERFAVRGWEGVQIDPQDAAELTRTRYLLQAGVVSLAVNALAALLFQPLKVGRALLLALGMARRADRAWPFHLMYWAEAVRLAAWMRQTNVRHLHAHFGTNSAEVAMLAQVISGIPYSFTVHGPEEFDKPEFLGLARKVEHASFVVAISSFGRSQLWRWLPSREWPKIHVVHCALEAEFFAAAHDITVGTAPRLVCVGRLCEQKGQLLLVQAAAQLAREGVPFELVLAGDGEMRPQIEAAIAANGLQQQVRITGWISSAQVRQELLQSRALVLPSFAEGLPVVIMEAMALGRPVISTYIAGIPELVRHRQDGWLISAGDVQALVGAMRECLAADGETLGDMSRSAHERVITRHHVDTEAQKLKALISQA